MKSRIKKIIRPRHRYYQIKNALLFVRGLYAYYKAQKLTPVQKEFARHLSFFRADTKKSQENGIVLVQMVKDYEYTVKLAAASKVIADHNHLRVSFYDPYITKIDYRNSPPNEKLYKRICDGLSQNQILNIYKSFGQDLLFSNSVTYTDKDKIQKKQKEILELIQSNGIKYIPDIEIENVKIGDLIYDTYLRSFHQPTIEKIDDSLILTIECALNIFYSFEDLIRNNKIKRLINTYSSYLHHGIPARICLQKNIDVYTLGSHYYILQKLKQVFPYHQINHTLFHPDKKLSDQQLELAKEKLTSRFEGKIDEATSYMRRSAYSPNPLSLQLKELFETTKKHCNIRS